jgi:hypothetical protein
MAPLVWKFSSSLLVLISLFLVFSSDNGSDTHPSIHLRSHPSLGIHSPIHHKVAYRRPINNRFTKSNQISFSFSVNREQRGLTSERNVIVVRDTLMAYMGCLR